MNTLIMNELWFSKKYRITNISILSTGDELENDIKAIVKTSMIKSEIIKNVWAEHVLNRPMREFNEFLGTVSGNNKRVSLKAINPEF